jgi:hypothetical protein
LENQGAALEQTDPVQHFATAVAIVVNHFSEVFFILQFVSAVVAIFYDNVVVANVSNVLYNAVGAIHPANYANRRANHASNDSAHSWQYGTADGATNKDTLK